MDAVEQKLSALNAFKDWSNYLLITTVAAVAWIGKDYAGFANPTMKIWSVWLFTASIVFGIATLALIPIVGERLDARHKSIYEVAAPFKLLWMWGPELQARLKMFCWPQHICFIAGMIAFAFGATGK